MYKELFDFVQLPFQFDQLKMIEELEIAFSQQWASHFNKSDYAGNWEIISLRSKSGIETDIHAFSESQYVNTPLMENCPYFKEISDTFKCEKEAVRLMNLKAGSTIKTHKDNAGGYFDGFCRIHVPISTNEKVSFVVNGAKVPMQQGQAWYANFSMPHSVKNDGNTDRIHLVIDCIRNSWTDELFNKLGYDFEAENIQIHDNETKKLMIRQLKDLNTPTSLKMALNLEKPLKES